MSLWEEGVNISISKAEITKSSNKLVLCCKKELKTSDRPQSLKQPCS